MRTAAMLLLVSLGIVTMPAVPWLGVPMVGYGIYLGSRADHEDVSRFVGALFALGLIGFVAAFFVGSKALD